MNARQGTLALAVVAIVWGASFTIIKLALRDASPVTFLAVRFLLATLPLVLVLRALGPAEWLAGAILGLFFWGGFVFQTTGLAHTTPARSAFITGLSTPLVPIVAFAWDRTRPPPLLLAGIVLALAGSWFLTDPRGGGLNRGDLLTLGCAVAFACQIVAAGHAARRVSPVRLLAVQLALTGVLSAASAPALETPRFHLTPALGAALVFLAATAIATFWAQLRAQRVVSPSTTALIFALEPVAAAATSWAVLGETLGAAQLGGAALILVGTMLPELPLGRGAEA